MTKSIAIGLLLLVASCGYKEPKAPVKHGVQNWKTPSVGGPIEVRPLPAASRLLDDYKSWMKETSEPIARVYETTLFGSNQHAFAVDVRRVNTPVGRPEHTYVTFLYTDPTNGTYKFLWASLGRHDADFMKLGNTPKQVWVTLNWLATEDSTDSTPLVNIQAWEGSQVSGVLVADPGGTLK